MSRPARHLSAAQTPDAALFAPPRVVAEAGPSGQLLLRAVDRLDRSERSITEVFLRRAAEHPERVLAAQRRGDEWLELTWGDASTMAGRIGSTLLDLGLGPGRPLMILSGNGLEHLLLMLGAFQASVPVVPVSPAYSLMSSDHVRLRQIAELCSPALVFADDAAAYSPALAQLRDLVPMQAVAHGKLSGAMPFDELVDAGDPRAAEPLVTGSGADTVAKILFTSGSTSAPKGVINTHRMMCSNQQALGQVWPFLHNEPPTLVDWLPWSHTFGGNLNVNQVLTYGGSLYIDDGRPVPALFERTVEALRVVRPTIYYNVPAGYALLASQLERDGEFAEAFFSRLRLMLSAAAALPQDLWNRLIAVADRVAARSVPLICGWGATETAPAATIAHFSPAPCGCIGVPLPGVTLKLVPRGERREVCVSGPNVTPGYYQDPGATAAAFDEDGFYRTGDAVRLVDPGDPNRGLMFDGRLAEDFKLATGTWVHVGQLRAGLVSVARVLSDAVICGENAEFVGALAWLNPPEASGVLGVEDELTASDPRLRAHLALALREMNEGKGSASRIERLLLLSDPPDIDRGETTDKAYINQRAVVARRADAVARLYADPVSDEVILPAEGR